MGFIKKIINVFKKKKITIKNISNPVERKEIIQNPNEVIFANTPVISKGSKINERNLDEDLKIRTIVRPKPRYFSK